MTESRYAPITAFVYNRPDKARKMLESLGKCDLAGESDLFIHSDGPRNQKAEKGVRETREYLDKILPRESFKSVTVIKAEKNKGLAASIISGVTDVLDKYGRVIVVEDDLVFSEQFLNYMNTCLDWYGRDRRIWSVSGYTPDLKSAGAYDKGVYLSYRGSSWGWGTWKDRWDMVDWKVSDYASFRFNPIENIRFCFGGNDQPSMLRAQMKGKLDSWAIRWCYCQSRNRMYSVVPRYTLVSNEGLDGSGCNSKAEDMKKLGTGLGERTGNDWCHDDLKVSYRMAFDFYRKYHLSLWVRIRDKYRSIIKEIK